GRTPSRSHIRTASLAISRLHPSEPPLLQMGCTCPSGGGVHVTADGVVCRDGACACRPTIGLCLLFLVALLRRKRAHRELIAIDRRRMGALWNPQGPSRSRRRRRCRLAVAGL